MVIFIVLLFVFISTLRSINAQLVLLNYIHSEESFEIPKDLTDCRCGVLFSRLLVYIYHRLSLEGVCDVALCIVWLVGGCLEFIGIYRGVN